MQEQQTSNGLTPEEEEWFAEADKRGLLSQEEKAWWDEGVKRKLFNPNAGQAYYEVTEEPKGPGIISNVAQTLQNIPADLIRTGGDLVEAFSHPVDTAGNLALMAGGLAQKGYRKIHDAFSDTPMEVPTEGVHGKAEQMADVLLNHYGNYFNGNGGKMVRERPVQAMLDFLPVTQGVKTAARAGAANLPSSGGLGIQATKAALEGVGKTAAALDPFKWPGGVMRGAKVLTDKTVVPYVTDTFSPEAIYSRAVMPGPRSMKSTRRDPMVKAGLEEEIQVGKEGQAKIWDVSERLHKEVLADVEAAEKTGKAGVISADDIAARARQKLVDQYGGQGADTIAKIDKALANWRSEVPDVLKLSEAQAEKQRIYRAYKNDKSWQSDAVAEKNKATREQVARELRQELEDRVRGTTGVEIGPKNAKQQALINLEGEIDAAMNRQANQKTNMVGLPGQLGAAGAGIGYAIGGPMGAPVGGFIGATAGDALRQPAAQAKIAFMLNKGLQNAAKKWERIAKGSRKVTQNKVVQLTKNALNDPNIRAAIKYGYVTPAQVTTSLLQMIGQQER